MGPSRRSTTVSAAVVLPTWRGPMTICRAPGMKLARGDNNPDAGGEVSQTCWHFPKRLADHLPAYDKGTFASFDLLWERLETAIANAARLRKSREEDPGQTAYTDVDLVITAMRDASRT